MGETPDIEARQSLDDAARIAENCTEPLEERIRKIHACLNIAQGHVETLAEPLSAIRQQLNECMAHIENH